MKRPANHCASLVAATLLLCAHCAFAEQADRGKPLNLSAERMVLDEGRQTSLFEGHVELVQGTLLIAADKIEVVEDKQGFQKLTATGAPARFRQKSEGSPDYVEGFGNRIEYDTRFDRVDFFTNARIKRGRDEVSGDHITYNSSTEMFEARGRALVAGEKPGANDRVRAVIQPKNDKKNSVPQLPAPNGLLIQSTPALNTPNDE